MSLILKPISSVTAAHLHLPTSGQLQQQPITSLIMTSNNYYSDSSTTAATTTTTPSITTTDYFLDITTGYKNKFDSAFTTPTPFLLEHPPTEPKKWIPWLEKICRDIFNDFREWDVFESVELLYIAMNVTQAPQYSSVEPVLANRGVYITDITGARPFWGDYFVWFQDLYWPTHCILCLIICTIGIFANVTNIIVLTRPHMITAVNTILTALAFFDLLVNMSTIPFVYHELSDQTNVKVFYHYLWALYILFHAHLSVTVHTVSLWLTCALATWRYYVVCRSKSSNQRILTIGLAKRIIVAIVLLVPVSCIPNYLSFDLVNDTTTVPNTTIYKVGYSDLSSGSWAIRTIHFSIYSVVDKLVPCVLLLFFTTALIRTLLKARKRRLRLNNHSVGEAQLHDIDKARQTGSQRSANDKRGSCGVKDNCKVIPNGGVGGKVASRPGSCRRLSEKSSGSKQSATNVAAQQRNIVVQQADQRSSRNKTQLQINESPRTTETENLAVTSSGSSDGSASDRLPMAADSNIHHQHQHPRALSNLIVESVNSATNNTTVSTTTFPLSRTLEMASDTNSAADGELMMKQRDSSSRSASTCGALNIYGGGANNKSHNCDTNQANVLMSKTTSQNLVNQQRNLSAGTGESLQIGDNFRAVSADARVRMDGRGSLETAFEARVRSVGSVHLGAHQMVKLQTTQRQLNQNETTTKLLIAVMVVFLICETPAGLLTAGCAIWGEPFFDNVYLPLGLVTDLLALLNSSVNFALYCLMSKQFRTTFLSMMFGCCGRDYESGRGLRGGADPSGRMNLAANKDKRNLNDLC